MADTDETTELWWPSCNSIYFIVFKLFCLSLSPTLSGHTIAKKCDLACSCCRKEFLHGLLNLETNILEFWLGTLHDLFLNGPFRATFSLFYSKQINVRYKSLLMTGFEPQTSGVGSDRSTN